MTPFCAHGNQGVPSLWPSVIRFSCQTSFCSPRPAPRYTLALPMCLTEGCSAHRLDLSSMVTPPCQKLQKLEKLAPCYHLVPGTPLTDPCLFSHLGDEIKIKNTEEVKRNLPRASSRCSLWKEMVLSSQVIWGKTSLPVPAWPMMLWHREHDVRA